ncbi:MAG: FAD:protein FMN transferase [Desulfobacterales bacterium]|jgi:thiamine biosynthesis lipoprotein
MKLTHQIILSLVILLGAAGAEAQKEHLIQGRTMGTTYHITVLTGYLKSISGLKEKIDARLNEINHVFSTYTKDSEISRFNALNKAGQRFRVSDDFLQVIKVGRKIYRLSEGAWDGTVSPLVDLWGFGTTQRKTKMPAASAIKALLPGVGFDRIQIIEPNFILKRSARITLDLNSIAKGFAVDQVSQLIAASGFENYLVEIGGEVYAAGLRKDSKKWRVGINRPQKDAAFNEVYKVVSLSNRGFATSGDYRNFFEIDGVRYSHVIDPRTGYPVSNGVVSVSIIADNCTLADGLATSIMVMGVEKGISLVNRLDNVEALIVVEESEGNLVDFYSTGFRADHQKP